MKQTIFDLWLHAQTTHLRVGQETGVSVSPLMQRERKPFSTAPATQYFFVRSEQKGLIATVEISELANRLFGMTTTLSMKDPNIYPVISTNNLGSDDVANFLDNFPKRLTQPFGKKPDTDSANVNQTGQDPSLPWFIQGSSRPNPNI